MVGRTILHYVVTAELGAGAMGRVYLARDERTGRMVALKFLVAGAAGDPGAGARLAREATAAARLSHPNIVALHAVEETAEGLFLVEEYVEGESLAARLGRGPLGPAELLRLARALAQALAHAHRHGVLHRDLKPGNVLVAADGTYKVADFGLARVEGAPTLTDTGLVVGTAAYLAPERARGHAGDARSDLFALGAVLYEAMTGRRAFAGETQAEVLYGVLNGEPRPPEVPTASLLPLAALVMRLLAKEPADRPPSAEAVLEALETLQSTPATVARRRRPRWLLPAVAALTVAAALVAVAWLRGRPGPVPADAGSAVAVLYFENVADPRDPGRIGSITGNLLITALAQAPHLNVLSTQRILDAMRQTGHGTADRDRAVALRVARRLHAGRIVTGSILQVVPALVMTAEVADVRSGRVLCAERVEGEPGQSVFQVVDALGARLLGRLARRDESARVAPVAQRTSADLEAQRRYLEGMERFAVGDLAGADSAFAAAAALDTSFAQAWYQLAITRWWGNEPDDARADLRRAGANAARLSPLEREITAGLSDLVDHRMPAARARFERLAAAHADEKLVLFGLEEACMHSGDLEGTVTAARQALAADPAFTLPGRHLVDALGDLGRYREAWRDGSALLRRDPRNELLYEGMVRLAAKQMDPEGLVRLVRERAAAGSPAVSFSLALIAIARDSAAAAPGLLSGPATDPGVLEQARLGTDYLVALRRGSFREAVRVATRAWRLAAGVALPSDACIPWAEGYFAAARAGDTTAAMAFADSISGRVGEAAPIPPRVYRRMMRGIAWIEMGHLTEARRELALAEGALPADLALGADPLAFPRAVLLRTQGRYAEALEQSRRATWPAWTEMRRASLALERARILMGLRRDGEALAALDSLVRCPILPPHRAVLLHFYRAQTLERLGRAGEAAAEHREFLRIWRDADPGQPEVAEAKAALARLARAAPAARRR